MRLLYYIYLFLLTYTTAAVFQDVMKNFHYFLRSLNEKSNLTDKIEKQESNLITYKIDRKDRNKKRVLSALNLDEDNNVAEISRRGFAGVTTTKKIKIKEKSSSGELSDSVEEWHRYWIEINHNARNTTLPYGDFVNMAAARPWGMNCGDHRQHDMPWGSCMLHGECDPEYRIYRGDIFCGRTDFVCCAIQLTTYDMYNAVESVEPRELPKKKTPYQRKRERHSRKLKIKRLLIKIHAYVRKLLNRIHRNATAARVKKGKQLKKYVKNLKKKYRQGRSALIYMHEKDRKRIDDELTKKLKGMIQLNRDYETSNRTFNGSADERIATMLRENFPGVVALLKGGRRSMPYSGNKWNLPLYDGYQ